MQRLTFKSPPKLSPLEATLPRSSLTALSPLGLRPSESLAGEGRGVIAGRLGAAGGFVVVFFLGGVCWFVGFVGFVGFVFVVVFFWGGG